MVASYKFEVADKDLGSFLSGVCKTNTREFIRLLLKSAGLSWASYWGILSGVRKSFVNALMWAKVIPTYTQIRKIFVEEKLQGPVNALLVPLTWWYPTKQMNPLLEKFYRELSMDELTRLGKRDHYQLPIVVFTDEKNLPLLMTMPNFKPYMREIELRLKGQKMNYSLTRGGIIKEGY